MSARRQPRSGFTIVEMLVVISIITVLAGLLLPALSGVQRRGKKADELSRIRQVGVAWNLYANGNQDSALPGFLPPDVQQAFRVNYRFPNKQLVPDEDAAEWPWRLLPYLDFDQDTVMDHLGLDLSSPLAMSDYGLLDPRFEYPCVPVGDDSIARPTHIARQPAFGYNAVYVGGWWEMVPVEDGGVVPKHVFSVRTEEGDRGPLIIPPAGAPDPYDLVRTVALSPSQIRNTDQLIAFCSSARLCEGEHYDTPSSWAGSHFVVAPILADKPMWSKSTVNSSDTIVEVQGPLPDYLRPDQDLESSLVPAPVGRYTGQAAVLFSDLHTGAEAPGALDDQRNWINGATGKTFAHTE